MMRIRGPSSQMIHKTRSGQVDDWLVYRKRLRRRLSDYLKSQPPHVKAARLADEARIRAGLPPRYQQRGAIGCIDDTKARSLWSTARHRWIMNTTFKSSSDRWQRPSCPLSASISALGPRGSYHCFNGRSVNPPPA